MPVDALAVLAAAIFLVRFLPQPVRLARSGVAEGVSPLAALNAVVAAAAWTAYGLSAHLTAVWVVSALALVLGVWTALLLRSRTTAGDLGRASLWAGSVVVAAALGRSAVVLAAGVLVTQGPQVAKALRETDLSGISPATWRISVADALAYGAYGLAVVDPALLGYSVVLLVCAAIVLVQLRRARPMLLGAAAT